MKMKIVYEAPLAELVEVRIEKGFLTVSGVSTVEKMHEVEGEWD